mmetsp:Transcript_37304/g.46992  ORF Transcript_37304/g.46992 Transcript_37304/m.46992 type:complete len:341 (+) Transcript_37304:58-1080(+)
MQARFNVDHLNIRHKIEREGLVCLSQGECEYFTSTQTQETLNQFYVFTSLDGQLLRVSATPLYFLLMICNCPGLECFNRSVVPKHQATKPDGIWFAQTKRLSETPRAGLFEDFQHLLQLLDFDWLLQKLVHPHLQCLVLVNISGSSRERIHNLSVFPTGDPRRGIGGVGCNLPHAHTGVCALGAPLVPLVHLPPPEPLNALKPIHHRHVQITEDHKVLLLLQFGEPLSTVSSRKHCVPKLFQDLHQKLSSAHLILNDKDKGIFVGSWVLLSNLLASALNFLVHLHNLIGGGGFRQEEIRTSRERLVHFRLDHRPRHNGGRLPLAPRQLFERPQLLQHLLS